MELVAAPAAYFEGTLLPWSHRRRTTQGIPLLLPRFVDPADRQLVSWESYVLLERRIFLDAPGAAVTSPPAQRLRRVSAEEQAWVDPETALVRGAHRAVVWHAFVEGAGSAVADGPVRPRDTASG